MQEHSDEAAHEPHRGEAAEGVSPSVIPRNEMTRNPLALYHLRGDPSHTSARAVWRALVVRDDEVARDDGEETYSEAIASPRPPPRARAASDAARAKEIFSEKNMQIARKIACNSRRDMV